MKNSKISLIEPKIVLNKVKIVCFKDFKNLVNVLY